MSKTVAIRSSDQFISLLQSSTIVVVDFWAAWCGPCKQIAPLYEQLSAQLSRPNKITFTKVDTDNQREITQIHNITAMPTFLVFKNGTEVTRIRGADPGKLSEAVKKLAAEADSSSSSSGFGEASGSGSASWVGAEIAKGYTDITSEVDVRGLDLLNSDGDFGSARILFETTKPSGDKKQDWVESDTDEQLMLYIPFQSSTKIHSLHITSLATAEANEEPMRPNSIKLYTNRAQVLGFEEADDVPATQEVELQAKDWDEKTGTAKVELRFVKFQNVTSLVLFVVDGDGTSEKVRVDRLRFVGESGQKRDMGKLEKVGEEHD